MTKKHYQDDVYLKSCESTIVAIPEPCCLVLDQTVFFPAGGGQPTDFGSIDDIPVFDVAETAEGVFHRLSPAGENDELRAEAFKVGQIVHCEIDWDRRFDHMQRHCGEHILSGIFFRLYKGVNRGFHMGEDYMTIDIDLPGVSFDMASIAVLEANKVIWADAPVTLRCYSLREEAAGLPLRKELTVDTDITIVSVGSEDAPADCVACCGTHPSSSGQVGLIKLLKVESYKGMSRVFFESGKRAYLHSAQAHQLLSTLYQKFSADDQTLLDKIKIQDEKNDAMRQELQKWKEIVIEKEALALIEATAIPELLPVPSMAIPEKTTGPQVIVREYDQFGINDLQVFSKRVCAMSPNIFVLISTIEKTLLLSRADIDINSELDCGSLIKLHAGAFNGKGGGSRSNGRAAFQSMAELDEFVQHLVLLLLEEV